MLGCIPWRGFPPGCYTQGETLEEVRANLREAAEGWLNCAHDEAAQRPADREGAA